MKHKTAHFYTVGELIEQLKKYPSSTPVAVHEQHAEAQGMLQRVKLFDKAEDFPYDKGDNVVAINPELDNTPILFLSAMGVMAVPDTEKYKGEYWLREDYW